MLSGRRRLLRSAHSGQRSTRLLRRSRLLRELELSGFGLRRMLQRLGLPEGCLVQRGLVRLAEEECDYDKDCPKGTCCCKDGSCSGKCCDHHPHHPHYPKPEPKPAPPATGGTVSSLPATGAGPNDQRNNLLGAVALGGAAAVLAARKLRETSGEATSQE